MAKDYASITGADIVKKIRKKNTGRIIGYSILIVVIFAFLVGIGIMLREKGNYFVGIFGILLCALFLGFAISSLVSAAKTLRDVPGCRVFRKFGSPDAIAMQIAEHGPYPLMPGKGVLITDRFIMKENDFETFVPYEDILLLYRKEHRTNGVLDSIFLVLQDKYGDKFEYPFKLGKKHADEMNTVAQEIAKNAPHCVFGYTKENMQYAEQNKEKLP